MKKEKVTLTVSDKDASKRIDVVLNEKFPSYSRTFFKRLIEENEVKVNGTKIEKSSYKVKANETIEFEFPSIILPIEELPSLKEDLGVKIIYEHPDFLIIYKPAGLMVHRPSLKSKTLTLVDWLIYHFKDLKNVGYEDRPGIVHRLDKDTSGILIIPRNNCAHTTFAQMFKDRKIKKIYKAIVKNHPSKEGLIEFNIIRHPFYKNRMTHTNTIGRDAITKFEVIEYFPDASFCQVQPITGRTHQIRVHFAAIDHPIIGDTLYGTPSKFIKRQALHAYKISFTYDNIFYSFSYDIPDDMKKLIEKLKK